MNQYITGNTIKSLREKQNLTQAQLANLLCVSDKTISKWERGRGFPDIVFLEPLSKLLKVSMLELLSGNTITNKNTSANIKKSCFYTCPICGNVFFSLGNALISCCGLQLPVLEIENSKNNKSIQENEIAHQHKIKLEDIEDELYLTMKHPMEKDHFISWIGIIRINSVEIIKFYPEENLECRIKYGKNIKIFAYCNRHGLFEFVH